MLIINNIPMKKFVVPFFTFALLLAGCGGGSGVITGLPVGDSDVPGVSDVPVEKPVSDSASESAAEELGEQMAEEMMGGVDIEFAEEGSGEVAPWPAQMPSDVPVFEYGKIDATEASPAGEPGAFVALQFREVEEGGYAKYEQDLISAGWTIVTDSAWDDEHISAEKGESRSIDVDVDPMGEGTAFLYYVEY